MAAKTVPITGSVLAWARQESGYTKSDLAERVKVSVDDLEAWEAEREEPTRGQFSKLWKALRRPSAVFFLPAAPVEEGLPTALRNAPGLGNRKLLPEEMNEIRRARRLQEMLSWALADDERDPVSLVQINSNADAFTLFHEYGHLLRRSDAACADFVSPRASNPSEERWCERFAAGFLLPEDGVRKEASKQEVSTTSMTSDPRMAWSLANRFGVSARAMALRLQELGLADKTLYAAVADQMRARDWNDAGGRGRGMTAAQQRIGQLGSRLPGELIAAAERGRMTTRDLADYLQLKTGQINDLKDLLVDH